MTGRSKRKLHSNISIKEVAQSLNVSAATVSRALSRPELLNKETRVRILEAVEHMGYRPNLIARGLRLKKTQLLFVVVPTLSPFFLEVFRGVERAARETNYSVLMGHTNREISRELIFIDQALAQRADGIVLVTSSSQNELVDRQGSLPPRPMTPLRTSSQATRNSRDDRCIDPVWNTRLLRRTALTIARASAMDWHSGFSQ